VHDGPSPTPPTIQQDQVEAAAKMEISSRREAPRRVQVDHPATSMSVRHGRGPEMLLTLLIRLLLLPSSRKTLDMLYLILIG
jgi:hypothetical protein